MTRGWITGLGEEGAHAAILGLLGLQTTIRLRGQQVSLEEREDLH
jgi:hypothetical protein